MSGPEKPEDAASLIAKLVDGLDPGTLVTKFVVVAEGIDSSGGRYIYTATNQGAQAWDTLGLLEYAITRERDEVP